MARSKHVRRAAAVFNNSHNTLQLVEVSVLSELTQAGWRCDEKDAEAKGLAVLHERAPSEHWDYVGTLLAECGSALTRGRIDWARDFDRSEVIS